MTTPTPPSSFHPGWDMTFSAPKSVSPEALYRGRRAVMHAHDATVRATLDWIEAEHLQTRGYDLATGRRPREAAALVTHDKKAEPVKSELVKLWHRRAHA